MNNLTDDEDFNQLLNLVIYPRKEQTFRQKPNHFEMWDDGEFIARFRLSKAVVNILIEHFYDALVPQTDKNHAVSPRDMIFITLRFLATGSILQVIGDFSGVDKSTVSRIITKVLRLIAERREEFIKMPSQQEEINCVRQGFYNIARFPRCIGALDCTHIKIQSPGGEEPEIYRNRKSFFSFNVQAVCDSDLVIRNIVCRWPGSTHDATIFNNSRLKRNLQTGDYGVDSLLIGDSGYGIKNYLITPLLHPVTPAEHLFNESQIRTRNPIERLFGVWKRRFPILALGIKLNIEKVESLVVATAVLHNIAPQMKDVMPPINEEVEAAIEVLNNLDINQNEDNDVNMNDLTRRILITEYFQNLL